MLYSTLQHLHAYWAYLVLLMIIIATLNGLLGWISKRRFKTRDLRISLFTLIVSHIQILIGIILFFISPRVGWFREEVEVSTIMNNAAMRLFSLEHPLMMIIAIILLTIGFSRHKKKHSSKNKFKTILFYYLIALILILIMIPWKAWLG